MIGKLLNRFLHPVGLHVSRWAPPPKAAPPPGQAPDPFPARLKEDPVNAALHLDHAEWLLARERVTQAFSELRTAEYLGAEPRRVATLRSRIDPVLPELVELQHNRFYRMHTMAEAIRRMAKGERASVLDVGGGDGELAMFIPEMDYCLAEPQVNGIAGEALPFPDASFDIVVACHVLEHIPQAHRTVFLDTLLSKARKGVILINPFHVEGTSETERLELVLAITGQSWAREHLDCVLPRTEEIVHYATERGLAHTLTPNATIPVTFGFVWVDHFSRKAKALDDRKRINRYMNTHMIHRVDSDALPTAYLVELRKA